MNTISIQKHISTQELKSLVFKTLEILGERERILVIPPDMSRFFSRAGEITKFIYEFYGLKLKHILPALGTHTPMTEKQIDQMFPGIPKDLFLVHNWRNDTVEIGTVPGDFIKVVSKRNELTKITIGKSYEVISLDLYNYPVIIGDDGRIYGLNSTEYKITEPPKDITISEDILE